MRSYIFLHSLLCPSNCQNCSFTYSLPFVQLIFHTDFRSNYSFIYYYFNRYIIFENNIFCFHVSFIWHFQVAFQKEKEKEEEENRKRILKNLNLKRFKKKKRKEEKKKKKII